MLVEESDSPNDDYPYPSLSRAALTLSAPRLCHARDITIVVDAITSAMGTINFLNLYTLGQLILNAKTAVPASPDQTDSRFLGRYFRLC